MASNIDLVKNTIYRPVEQNDIQIDRIKNLHNNYLVIIQKEQKELDNIFSLIDKTNLDRDRLEECKVDTRFKTIKNIVNDTILGKTEIILKKELLFNIYKLINEIFMMNINNYINNYRLPRNSIIFILKGGNIQDSIIKSKLNDIINNNVEIKNLINYKYSDLDFEILVNDLITNKILNKQKIISDLKKLSYILLYRIRNIILSNRNVFDLSSNLEEIKNELNIGLQGNINLQNTKILNLYLFDKKANDEVKQISQIKMCDIKKITNGKTSFNHKIPYLQDSQDKIYYDNLPIIIDDTYNLVSLKININCDYEEEKNINSTFLICDLIDIKISTKKFLIDVIDLDMKIQDDIINIKNYNLNFTKNDTMQIKSYNFNHYIKDLIITITSSPPDFPWYHYKYEKRMNRLLLFFLIDMIAKKSDISSFYKKLNELRDKKININIKDKKADEITLREYVSIHNIREFATPNLDGTKLYDFFIKYVITEHSSIINKLGGNPSEVEKYKEQFLNFIIKKLDIFIPIIERYNVYDNNEIMFKKYLKYKNKYLSVKNQK